MYIAVILSFLSAFLIVLSMRVTVLCDSGIPVICVVNLLRYASCVSYGFYLGN